MAPGLATDRTWQRSRVCDMSQPRRGVGVASRPDRVLGLATPPVTDTTRARRVRPDRPRPNGGAARRHKRTRSSWSHRPIDQGPIDDYRVPMSRVVGRLLVAIVDDVPLFRRSIERLLKLKPVQVESFGSAEAYQGNRYGDYVSRRTGSEQWCNRSSLAWREGTMRTLISSAGAWRSGELSCMLRASRPRIRRS